jgi:alpha-galactosidase
MKYYQNKVTDLKIAYVGGGSRGWAWRFMSDLAMEEQIDGTVYLYDIDEMAAKNNEIIGNKIMNLKGSRGHWKFITSPSLKEALQDANFVLISILPGTFDEMQSDVHYPEKYGIYQSVGDTVGPGGIIRSLRTLPMISEIGESVKQFCPDAWVINYTNPMSACTRILFKTFPQIKAFGCCHEVFGTQKTLARIVEKSQGIKNVKRTEIDVNIIGINHFTWFTEASYKGLDLFPIYSRFMQGEYDEDTEDGKIFNKQFRNNNFVKYDLFKNYGCIAAAGDRHLAEFMPGEMYLEDPETVDGWGFSLTTVDWRKEDLENRMTRAKHLASGEEQLKLQSSGEEGVTIIKALCGLGRYVTNVNIPNFAKQIGNFPRETVVETNAVFTKNNVRPVYAGNCPEKIYRLELPHIENQNRIVEAARNYNKQLIIEAVLNDPLVKYRVSEFDVVQKVDHMINNTLKYLPPRWSELV